MNPKDYRNTWYITKTLLGCEPDHDINRRSLYCGDKLIWRWNEDMDVWPKWKDVLLDRIAYDLNQVTKDKP